MIRKTSAARRLLVGAAFAATFAAGGLVLPSTASAMQDAMAQGGAAHDGMAQGGMDGHMGHMGPMGAMGHVHAMLRAHIAHMLEVAQATPEQKAKIRGILKAAMQQIAPLHQKLAGAHRELHRLLTAPTIDRAALEQLRAAHMAEVDQASRILVGALADAAEVLTPEQRARLAAAMEHHRAHHPHP